MDYKVYKYDNYNIHVIKTDKFKNIKLDVKFISKYSRENIYDRLFLNNLLVNWCKKYSSIKEVTLRKEDLYGAYLSNSNYTNGGVLFQNFAIDFLDPKLVQEDYLEDSISFLFEFIFNPDIDNNKFNSNLIELTRRSMIKKVNLSKENLSWCASKKALELMDKDSLTSVDLVGSEEIYNSIDNDRLINSYNDLINNSIVDIYIAGNIQDDVVDIIKKYALFKNKYNGDIKYIISNKFSDKVNVYKEYINSKQSNLVYILNICDLSDFEFKYIINLYSTILGGGSLESKLYRHVRGDNSLCYSIYCSLLKRDGLMLIKTAVDKNNIDLAIKLIDETLEDMNNISDDELKIAKLDYINYFNGIYDSIDSIIYEYYTDYIYELDSVEERIKGVNNISIDDIVSINNKIRRNMIFELVGDSHEED